MTDIGAITQIDRSATFDIQTDQLTVEQPILIDGDANFSATADARGWTGNGTVQSPYLIDSISIESDGLGTLINIRNSNAYFIISNSFLNNSRTAILLDLSTNGIVRDNIISHSGDGIYLLNSNNINVTGNTIHDTWSTGIYLNRADNNIVSGNTMFDNWLALSLERADRNQIIQNNISLSYTAMQIVLSSRNSISQNEIYENQEGIFLSTPFLTNVTKNILRGNDLGLFATGSQDNLYDGNVAYNNIDGIHIDRQARSVVSNNLAYNNTESGIAVSFGTLVEVHHNEAFENQNGLRLYFGDSHIVHNNSLHDNAVGMYLDSIENYQISDHDLINNGFFIAYYLDNLIYHKINSLDGNTVNGLPVKYLNHTVGETVTGIWGQVLLVNSSFTNINNVKVNNSSAGIFLSSSSNNTISNVHLADNDIGVGIYSGSDGNVITNSILSDNDKGVNIQQSQFTRTNATDIHHNRVGIFAENAENTRITGNRIHHNAEDGIRMRFSGNSQISSNFIYTNGYGSKERFFNIYALTLMEHEPEYDFPENGVSLIGGVGHSVESNAIYSNKGYGLLMTGFGLVTGNDFVVNNDDFIGVNATRSCDTGCNQVFSWDTAALGENHYGELGESYTDINGDGYMDIPYEYQCGFEPDGSSTLCDATATSDPVSGQHFLTAPEITNFQYISNPGVAELEVSWTGSFDSAGHDVSYVLVFTLSDSKQQDTNTKFFSDPFNGVSLRVNVADFPANFYKVEVIASDGTEEAISEPVRIEIRESGIKTSSNFGGGIGSNSIPPDDITGSGRPFELSTSSSSTSASTLNTTRGRSNLSIYSTILAIALLQLRQFRSKKL